jgi:hypothetical protein
MVGTILGEALVIYLPRGEVRVGLAES